MKDMGEKIGKSTMEKEKYYPSVNLTKEDIGDKDVGDEFDMTIHCKVVGCDISQGEKKRYRIEFRKFDIKNGKEKE